MSINKKKLNIFEEDKIRSILIKTNKIKELRGSYIKRKVRNLNTSNFWDKHINKSSDFKKQDKMTKDRIRSAVKFTNIESGKLLDIGLGCGFFEKIIKKEKPKINLYGIDISKSAIKKIKQNSIGVFKIGSVLEIPFKQNFFDVVIALEVLEHIPATEIFSVYKEIKRVLKKKGKLILSIPVYENCSIKKNPSRHMRAYTPEIIITELTLAGFKINKIKTFCAFAKYYYLKKVIRLFLPKKWKQNIVLIRTQLK